MTFRTEFPDFDPATMPAIPAGWRNGSWHNDACPFWHVSPTLGVFIDYASPADRECADGLRFMVMRMEDDMHPASDDGCLLATDDWAAVLALAKMDAARRIIPGHENEAFVALFVTSQHEADGEYLEPTEARPANLFSVRGRTEAGPAFVLTDHGTADDATAAAALLSALTGLPVET